MADVRIHAATPPTLLPSADCRLPSQNLEETVRIAKEKKFVSDKELSEVVVDTTVQEADVDKGYRGHDYKGSATIRIAGSSNKGLRWSERKRKRRRSSVEPVIGHLKSDHRLDRCFLHGRIGDKLNLIGSAAGFNVRKLLSLLGTGIFSRALLVWEGFCRFLSSWARPFCIFSAA
jgi:hypothetical protein